MTEKKISPFIEYKLRLIGEKLSDFPRAPTLKVDYYQNNLSLTCYPGNVDDQGRAVNIRAGVDAFTFQAIIDLIQRAIVAEPGFRRGIKCRAPRKRKEGERGIPKVLAATILVGKDKEGRVNISVVKKDPPHVKFVFRPSEWHELINEANEILPEAEMSEIYAKAWAGVFSGLAPLVMNDNVYDYREDPRRNTSGNKQRQSNYQPDQQNEFDDIFQ